MVLLKQILNMVEFMDIMGFLHGIVLGLLLVFRRHDQKQPLIFLGFYLMAIGCNFLPSVLGEYSITDKFSWLKFQPIRFYFLTDPLLYCYVWKLAMGKEAKVKKRHFAPGAIEFLVLLVLFLFPTELKNDLYNHVYYEVIYRMYNLSAGIFSIYYLLKILKLVNTYHSQVNNFFVDVDGKLLVWVKKLVFASLFIFGVGITFSLTPLVFDMSGNYLFVAYGAYFLINVLQLILVYWVSIQGIRQAYSPLVFYKEMNQLKTISKVKVAIDDDGDEELGLLYTRILMEIEKTACFKNVNLTIIDLGYILEVHPKKISTVINSKGNMNFNAFINMFRVEEAKKLLSEEDDTRKLSVVGIGKEVGFKSSSAFYRAFKNIEDVTPGRFR